MFIMIQVLLSMYSLFQTKDRHLLEIIILLVVPIWKNWTRYDAFFSYYEHFLSTFLFFFSKLKSVSILLICDILQHIIVFYCFFTTVKKYPQTGGFYNTVNGRISLCGFGMVRVTTICKIT